MFFDELDLNSNILDALYDMRFEECTPVQEKCIPEILKGKDVLGIAQTGTGKTAAYLLPILSKLEEGTYPDDSINCVIMSPTRELAQQIDQAFQGFGYYLNGVSSVAVYGGNDGNRFDQETKGMRMGADVVIATPGRFISHINIGNVDLSKTSFFVLDEADRMLDMGFSEDILSIARLLPKTCQMIMFSATMPAKIEDLAKTLLKEPVVVKLAVSKPAEKIRQSAYVCYEPQKIEIIKRLFKADELKRVIIFCGKKTKVKEVSRTLTKANISVGEMHSDLTQAERDDIMFKFKSGQTDVLVATDIVARGIDIDDIAMVINYDVPHDAEDYVHRIGRTARADKDGSAITFVSENDIAAFMDIEKFLEQEVTKNPMPEGMIEGPEYKIVKRGSRSSGRGNDDRTSRRRKPRRKDGDGEARSDNRRPRKDKGEAGDGGKTARRSDGNKVTADRTAKVDNTENTNGSQRAGDGQQAAGDGQERRRRYNRKNRSRRDESQTGQTENKKPVRSDDKTSADKNSRPRRSRPKSNRPDRSGVPRQRSAVRQNSDDAGKRDEKKTTGLKSLLNKPLKWLKSIGKH